MTACARLCFFHCDACCFGHRKPTRLQLCVSKHVIHSVKSASTGVKMSLKGWWGFSCHSFWTEQRGCVMPQLVDILLFTVLDPQPLGLNSGHCCCFSEDEKQQACPLKRLFARSKNVWYVVFTGSCSYIRVYEVEATVCQSVKRPMSLCLHDNDRQVPPRERFFSKSFLSFFWIFNVFLQLCMSPNAS